MPSDFAVDQGLKELRAPVHGKGRVLEQELAVGCERCIANCKLRANLSMRGARMMCNISKMIVLANNGDLLCTILRVSTGSFPPVAALKYFCLRALEP